MHVCVCVHSKIELMRAPLPLGSLPSGSICYLTKLGDFDTYISRCAGEKKVLLSIAVRFHTEELLLNQRWVYHLFEICLMYMTLGFRLKVIGKKTKNKTAEVTFQFHPSLKHLMWINKNITSFFFKKNFSMSNFGKCHKIRLHVTVITKKYERRSIKNHKFGILHLPHKTWKF